MDAGTLVWILLIGGGVFAMFFMHRGGHAHGGLGGGGGCGGHGHDHSDTSAEKSPKPRNEDARPLAESGLHDHGHKPVPAGGKHRGC